MSNDAQSMAARCLIRLCSLAAAAVIALPAVGSTIEANGGPGGNGGQITISGMVLSLNINLNASGGTDRCGGNIEFHNKGDEIAFIGETLTFRALSDCSLQYPEFITGVNAQHKKVLIARAESTDGGGVQTKDVNDWYRDYREALINNFHPNERGAIGARVKIHHGMVQAVEYFGFNHSIPFYQNPATMIPPSAAEAAKLPGSEAKMKENVSAALTKTASDLCKEFPSDANDVELKFIFAGDPNGKGYWWTSYFLIDKVNYKPQI